jgi:hypothetical protein
MRLDMIGKLSVALLLSASPAPATSGDQPAQEYEVKKVCRTVQEIGSLIPQRTCTTKRIPVQKPDADNPKGGADAGSKPVPR